MPQYTFTQRYRSSYGQGDEGDVVDLTEQQAADINRDSPGTLAPVVDEPDAETRALDAPPKNRQVTGGRKRGQKADGDA